MRISKSTTTPRLLAAVDYPTDREELLRRAHEIDAPEAVRDAIRRLRPGAFFCRNDLVAAVEAITSAR